MEKMGSCACTTPACTECLPVCGRAEQNRWATVLEALTGGFNGFSCTSQTRNTSSYSGQYDFGYYLPHIALNWSSQNDDGVLDVYRDRVRFGLMTFDGVGTFTDSPPIVPESLFRTRLADSAGWIGSFSYGTPQPFTFPGCGVRRMMDNGARNENLGAPGRLVSVGTDTDDQTVINQTIQSALLDPTLRPFGATPVAGMLDDLRYYLDNHPDVKPVRAVGDTGDPYAACRSRYTILLTDGYPNADMRGSPYFCDTPGYTCPYPTPEDTARNLCAYSSATSSCGGKIDGLYVVGWAKRGPTGVIGTNKLDSVETVNCMLEDLAHGPILRPSEPEVSETQRLVRERQPNYFSFADWLRLDAIEVQNGRTQDRPREKFTRVEDMLAALGR